MKPATHALPGLLLTNRMFELPLDYANPGRRIEVFVREVVAPAKEKLDLPYVVFFQGGPGSGSPRPMTNSGWIKRMSQEFRVLLLDQRGTGISTPVTAQALRGLTPQAQAEYLRHFRADNIVRDAEAIRRELIGERPWTILGQSYGGFCALRYLSAAPEGLEAALITGGIPSLTRPADDVYRATYPRVAEKNRRYFARYPGDRPRVNEIAAQLRANDVRMPGGGRLTVERFQQLGLQFGMSDGFEMIHYLLEEAFIEVAGGAREVNWNFLFHLDQLQSFDTNPIFSVLHEACYAQGEATRWSAERLRAEFPEFDPGAKDVLFTGEMIYPWMFDSYPQLAPLKGAAEILAEDASWPRLYDVDRLRENRVPVAAAVYYDDMYVHREFSEETARIVPGMKLWITNQYEHNGLRADGEAVVGRLLQMLRGESLSPTRCSRQSSPDPDPIRHHAEASFNPSDYREWLAQAVLPDSQNSPTSAAHRLGYEYVAFTVVIDLVCPEPRVPSRCAVAATATMPEAPIDIYGQSFCAKGEVGLPG